MVLVFHAIRVAPETNKFTVVKMQSKVSLNSFFYKEHFNKIGEGEYIL